MKLKEIRIKSGRTQQEVAKEVNLTQNTYSNYENEKTEPDIKTLIKLADYFHTTIDCILEHEVPYLLDKSILNNEQKNLINKIIDLNKEQCMLVDAYIEGLKVGQQKHEETIKRLKGE